MVDAIIIGAGPAGIAAAIQFARLGREIVVFERNRVGGLLVNAHLVENYPGLSRGISGPALVKMMEDHLASQSVSVRFEEVLRVEATGGYAIVDTACGRMSARTVIVASGTRPRVLSSPPVAPELTERVFSEVHPIREVEGKSVAIMGAGDAAFDYALTLESKNRVVILNRGGTARCLRLLQERAGASPNIARLDHTRVTELLPKRRNGGDYIGIRCAQPERNIDLEADYLLLAIGREPEVAFLSPSLRAGMGTTGCMPAALDGGPVWFVGDVARGKARQTAIAVGDGVAAAMQIHQALAEDRT